MNHSQHCLSFIALSWAILFLLILNLNLFLQSAPCSTIFILIYNVCSRGVGTALLLKGNESKFGPKIRYFDCLNSILHVLSIVFLLESRWGGGGGLLQNGAYITINTVCLILPSSILSF